MIGLLEFLGGLDHFNRAGVFCTGFHDERRGANESLKVRSFFEGYGASARDLAANGAVDRCRSCDNRMEKLDTGFFFDTEGLAADVTDDFSTAADDEVAGALHCT